MSKPRYHWWAYAKAMVRQNGDIRLALIDLVFWKQSHKLDGAAMKLYISEQTARRYHKEFIWLVGFCYGLEDVVEGA